MKICNVCGATQGKGKYKALMINPGYTTKKMCHRCYQHINWKVLAGLRRLGIFGTIKEPRSIMRKYTDEQCIRLLMDTLQRKIQEKV